MDKTLVDCWNFVRPAILAQHGFIDSPALSVDFVVFTDEDVGPGHRLSQSVSGTIRVAMSAQHLRNLAARPTS